MFNDSLIVVAVTTRYTIPAVGIDQVIKSTSPKPPKKASMVKMAKFSLLSTTFRTS